MKKLLAILLSVLMLCSVIPFAAVSVSAAGEYSIELVADAEEVDAGDEVTVEVSLYGHESVGLIGTQVELLFDHDVFELVTYYDEDEEVWMPPIEVGPKYNASSNKYILFSPIDEETGYMERCLVFFQRATASASQAVKTNLFYTVTFKVKDDAPSGTYTLTPDTFQGGNTFTYGNVKIGDEIVTEPIEITVNGSDPVCQHEYDNACDVDCNLCYETREVEHSVKHVAAAKATCAANGNIEYWYCDVCGMAWLNAECTMNTNLRAVVLPATGEHVYTTSHDASCNVCGAIRDVVLNAGDIIIEDGLSISKDKTGLAFKFDVTANGITFDKEYNANYSNATVTVEDVEYKLVKLGAIVNNLGLSDLDLSDVNDAAVQNVEALKVFEDAPASISYAVRVIDIPEEHLNAEITVRPYYIYEANGELITVYGEDIVSSYTAAQNG